MFGFYNSPIRNVLQAVFNNDVCSVEVASNLTEWHVARRPTLYMRATGERNKEWFIRSGYEAYERPGTSKFEWLRGICASMGWVFYLTAGGNVGKPLRLVIKERADYSQPIKTFDLARGSGKLVDMEVSQSQPSYFDAILIPNGYHGGSINNNFPTAQYRPFSGGS